MMLPALVSYRRTERVIETGAPLQPMSWATPLAVVVVGGAVVLVLFSLVRR
jgi:hypothetical protein